MSQSRGLEAIRAADMKIHMEFLGAPQFKAGRRLRRRSKSPPSIWPGRPEARGLKPILPDGSFFQSVPIEVCHALSGQIPASRSHGRRGTGPLFPPVVRDQHADRLGRDFSRRNRLHRSDEGRERTNARARSTSGEKWPSPSMSRLLAAPLRRREARPRFPCPAICGKKAPSDSSRSSPPTGKKI